VSTPAGRGSQGQEIGAGRYQVRQFQNEMDRRLGVPLTKDQLQTLLAGGPLIKESLADIIKKHPGMKDDVQKEVLKEILREMEAGRGPGAVHDKFVLATESPGSRIIEAGLDPGRDLLVSHPLKMEGIQPRYRLELAVEAADNDVETDTRDHEVKKGE